MSNSGRTLLGRAYEQERDALGYSDGDDSADDDAGRTVADVPGLTARSTTIGGEEIDLADPATNISFDDESGHLSGEYGRPRPRKFWHAKQIGQTPQMQLIKHTIIQQLTGGRVQVVSDDELTGPLADFADLVEDVYAGPHFQEKSNDDLISDAVSDMVDLAWSYWEKLPSEDGAFPVAAFKPLPPLQVQHNVDGDTGALEDDPAFYHVPFTHAAGTVSSPSGDPTELKRDDVVVMRGPLTSESDSLYGESLATKVREWLELITDVDVHQKRHYADSHLPAGFLHFLGSIDDDDLTEIEQDIKEVAGDPQELVTTTSEEGAEWIPVGDKVADLDAIQQQDWYFKLVLAAAGLNKNELGMVDGGGFAKETPALQRAIYKKVTKPYMQAIFGAQNNQVLPDLVDSLGVGVDAPLRIELERFDPVQEQVEREETLGEWQRGIPSLNEVRGTLGRETEELVMEFDGNEVDLADTPRWIVDLLLKRDRPEVSLDGEDVGADGGE